MAIAGEKVYEATIGSALAQRREKLGLSRVQAADHIGMSRTTYSSYERDTQRPSVDVFPVLADFLDISMDDLLNLYGATSIAAVRPSLQQLLAERANPSTGTEPVASAPPAEEPQATSDAEPEAPAPLKTSKSKKKKKKGKRSKG